MQVRTTASRTNPAHLLLMVWLIAFAGATIAMPMQAFTFTIASLVAALALAGWFFPGMALTVGIMSIWLSPENFYFYEDFVKEHFETLGSHSVHKVFVLMTMMPALLRLGIRTEMNWGILAIGFIYVQSCTVASRFPGLDQVQMIKSVIGLALPFIFFSMRIPRSWIEPNLALIAMIPIFSILFGYIAEGLEVHDVDSEPWAIVVEEFTGAHRLRGLNIPPELAAWCYFSIFVSVYQAVLYKKTWYFLTALISLFVIILTGTRTPTVCAIFFAALAVLLTSPKDLRGSSKFLFMVLGIAFFALVVALSWENLQARLFGGSTAGEDVNTSGRSIIWDIVLSAYQQNPLFGRGIGTGAIILLDENKDLAQARATHNEYLRLLVDGGILGLAAYIIGLIMQLRTKMKGMSESGQRMVIAFMLSFALYSFTDNTISGPITLVLFFALELIFARSRYDQRDLLLARGKSRDRQ